MILAQKIKGKLNSADVKNKKFDRHYDVIIAGLGTAGIVAAAAAALKGLKTLGIERLNCSGGAGTAGSVGGYYFGSRGGLYESIEEEAARAEKDGFSRGTPINNDARKYAYEQAFLKEGGEIIYEAAVCGVYLDERKTLSGRKRVTGLRWFDGTCFNEAGADFVIDCTAEAVVCEMAGCSLRRGRELDGQAQPYSNVLVRMNKGVQGYSYTDCGYVDQSDAEGLSEAVSGSATMLLHLKDTYDEEPRFLQIAPLIGIREGFLIEGEENVTFEECMDGQIKYEPVFYAYSNIDNHGKDLAFESAAQKDWTVACSLWGLNITIPVPAGALIPKGFDGILAAGRHIAVDHDLASAVRMKRDMQKCGEAAAVMAAAAIEKGCSASRLKMADIRPMLEEHGCLDESNNVGLKISVSHKDDMNIRTDWLSGTEEIRAALSSDNPGIAIWSCRRLMKTKGSSIMQNLSEWMKEETDSNLSANSAIALALSGVNEAAPKLRKILIERDMYLPSTSRSYNQERGYVAAYLLGRLRDPEAVECLLDVICKGEAEFCASHGEIKTNEFIGNAGERYFQYFSHALMSLLAIGESCPGKRAEIAAALHAAISAPGFSLKLTLKSSNKLIYDMTDKVRSIVEDRTGKWWSEIVTG